MKNQTINTLFRRLWHHINLRRKKQILLLLLLTVIASFVEIMSIGAVVPFLAVITSPERVFSHEQARILIQLFSITRPDQLVLALSIIFTAAIVFAALTRLLLLWLNTKISFAVGADIGISIYRRTLFQPYHIHISRNSSEIINGITFKSKTVINGFIFPSLEFINVIVILCSILFALLLIQPLVALSTLTGFSLIYGIIILLTNKKLQRNSECIARESQNVMKALQEGLGGIRDILIDGNQEVYCNIYQNADRRMRLAQGNLTFIGGSPRHVIEAIGTILIIALTYFLSRVYGGITGAIPILGVLALGIIRLMPVLQKGFAAWTSIQGGRMIVQDTLDLLDQPFPEYIDKVSATNLTFEKEIILKNIKFQYNFNLPYVLKGINVHIAKGECIGIIGKTGSGKSTLLDIIMGLLAPTSGNLIVDNEFISSSNVRAWQARIAHVPQMIFLADSTIEENIAFGVPKDNIDFVKVREAAQQANIADSIQQMKNQYKTLVGERGIRLSGGQRQRIGIARALYKNADVIIFDEATSALDHDTENSVINTIGQLSKNTTMLIIAHRITTLKNCTRIIELDNGVVKRIGSYSDVIKAHI